MTASRVCDKVLFDAPLSSENTEKAQNVLAFLEGQGNIWFSSKTGRSRATEISYKAFPEGLLLVVSGRHITVRNGNILEITENSITVQKRDGKRIRFFRRY